MTKGSLTVIGTGIRAGQLTIEACAELQNADIVLYSVPDEASVAHLLSLNERAYDISEEYILGRSRLEVYRAMVLHVMRFLDAGNRVCLVLYGHPGVLAYPAHESIKQARKSGCAVDMLPGVSAEDNLFADLGLDPLDSGCASFEASSFLLYRYEWDPRSNLIIWQIGNIGQGGVGGNPMPEGLSLLRDRLLEHYEPSHSCIIYECSRWPFSPPTIQYLTVDSLVTAFVTTISTLYVYPIPVESEFDIYSALQASINISV